MRRRQLLCGALTWPALLRAKDMPRVSPASIEARFGKPDRILSTENDKPRPPMVTMLVIYTKERVQFALLADAPMGAPPPYKGWLLVGIQDPATKRPLTSEEVQTRMKGRVRK